MAWQRKKLGHQSSSHGSYSFLPKYPGLSIRSVDIHFLTHWPLGEFVACYEHFLWNCSQVNLINDKSTLVEVKAWCRQASSHYLGQYLHRSMLPYGVILCHNELICLVSLLLFLWSNKVKANVKVNDRRLFSTLTKWPPFCSQYWGTCWGQLSW